jgi:hypothetical protein
VQNKACEQRAGKVRREHDRPKSRHPSDVFPGELGRDRQNCGDRAFGEELLTRQHRHDEADAIPETRHERLPGRIRADAYEGSPAPAVKS